MSDEGWMRRALELAQLAADLGEVPVGAVLVADDQLIGSGHNQPISKSDPSAHAEIMALRDAGQALGNYRLVDTTLYVTLEPCTMCVGAMIHARVGRLVFGAFEPKAGAVSSQLQLLEQPFFNHKTKVQGGVLEEECATLLKQFFRARR